MAASFREIKRFRDDLPQYPEVTRTRRACWRLVGSGGVAGQHLKDAVER